jgi:hypothetical protein
MVAKDSLVGVLGALSNSASQERLQRLADKLDRLARSKTPRRPSGRADQRTSHRAVLRAVNSVLERSGQPMRTGDIHRAVIALMKQPVSYSSIKRCLAKQTQGQQASLERIARGYYQLRRSC